MDEDFVSYDRDLGALRRDWAFWWLRSRLAAEGNRFSSLARYLSCVTLRRAVARSYARRRGWLR